MHAERVLLSKKNTGKLRAQRAPSLPSSGARQTTGDPDVKFENQTFTNTIVTLDCNEFVDCVIKDCQILFQGGPYSLIRTKLENVRFGIGGAAAQSTLAFLRVVRASGPHLVEELLDQGDQPQHVVTRGTATN